jgi:hypothetical protein
MIIRKMKKPKRKNICEKADEAAYTLQASQSSKVMTMQGAKRGQKQNERINLTKVQNHCIAPSFSRAPH